MPRIAPAYALDDASKHDTAIPGGRELTQYERVVGVMRSIFAYRSRAMVAWEQMRLALEEEGTLTPRLVELMRLRMAFHHQCRLCASYRVLPEEVISEELVCQLEQPSDAPDLSDAERAVLRFVDLFCTNHLAIDDAEYDKLREHFDEGDIVGIGLHCARMFGLGRLLATWHPYEDLPAAFQVPDDERITPWGHGELVVRRGDSRAIGPSAEFEFDAVGRGWG